MELVNLGSLIIQAINLSIVVFVLYHFLFKPYLRFIDAEIAKREVFEESLRTSTHIISDARHEASGIIDEAKNEARNIVAEAEKIAKKEQELIIAEARREADQIKAKGLQDIENERRTLYDEMRDKVLAIALRANEKFFGQKNANASFIEQAVKENTL